MQKIKKELDDQKKLLNKNFNTKVAILGPTNCGKSTLLNRLLGFSLFNVSEIRETSTLWNLSYTDKPKFAMKPHLLQPNEKVEAILKKEFDTLNEFKNYLTSLKFLDF